MPQKVVIDTDFGTVRPREGKLFKSGWSSGCWKNSIEENL